jgi:hypothetical protein
VAQPQALEEPATDEVPQDELVTEDLEQLEGEGDNFHIEDEPAVVEEETPVMELDELPAEEAVLEEEPLAEAPAEAPGEELEEFPLDEDPLEELPAEEHARAAAVPAVYLEEFELEETEPEAELTGEHEAVAEAPAELDDFELEDPATEPAPVAAETPAAEPELTEEEFELEAEPVAEAAAADPELTEDLEGFELEEEPIVEAPAAEAPVAEAPAAEPVVDELELTEEDLESPAAPAIQPPPESVGELEFEDEAFELEETHPATPEAVSSAPQQDPLALAPAPPAYTPVDIDAADDEIEELELDATTNGEATEAAGESSWDFVIEETDATRSHHDFKLDFDSPHEQPHGQ